MNIKQLMPTIIAALVILVVVGKPFYIVDETEQVIITQFGEPMGGPVTKAGLHFKVPFFQVANSFDKRVLEWDGDPNEVPTRDKKFIWIDTTGRWRISDPLRFLQTVHDERTAQGRLDDIVDSATRDAMTSNYLIELVRNSQRKFEAGDDDIDIDPDVAELVINIGREQITRSILEHASREATQLGIELIDVRIKRINYIDMVLRDVYERMISERKRIAELYRSEGQGKKAEIEGQGDIFQLVIKEFKAFPDHFVNFNIAEPKGFFAAEVEELTDNLADAIQAFIDQAKVALPSLQIFGVFPQAFYAISHATQRIVDLMGNSSRQLADSGHFFVLKHLLPGFL